MALLTAFVAQLTPVFGPPATRAQAPDARREVNHAPLPAPIFAPTTFPSPTNASPGRAPSAAASPAVGWEQLLTPEQRREFDRLPAACFYGAPRLPEPPTATSWPASSDRRATPFADSMLPAPRHVSPPAANSPAPTAPTASPQLPNPHARATQEATRLAPTARYAALTNSATSAATSGPGVPQADPHAEIFSKSCFPSALECRKCHEQIYEEWAISSHANAGVSPMFHKFEQKAYDLTRGTLGTFCMRCHAPVAVAEGWPRHASIFDAPRVYREGVTCVVCHRVAEEYGKVNGERRLEPGPLEAPVYGAGDGDGVEMALRHKDFFKLKTSEQEPGPGNLIHRRAIRFQQLSESSFCASCHQVAVQPGIKLEVVWDQYRASPACRQGVRCQDCHMGKVPGRSEGFSPGPVAVVAGKASGPDRRHSNHVFYGPGYSIAHPGIYPPSAENEKFGPRQWLAFDWRAGWGTDAFEKNLPPGGDAAFPSEWRNADDRYDARELIDANLKKLAYKADLRRQVMENGSRIDGPFFNDVDPSGQRPVARCGQDLAFHYVVTNTNPGHNAPSGSLGAQPQLWLNVRLIGPSGEGVWESGYLDSRGDLCDLHSLDVRDRRIPLDQQLFNLQTKFLIANLKGTDREMYLPFNIDLDQLPFARPAPQPVSVMNHPPFVRMEAHSLPPLGSRRAPFHVPGQFLRQPGVYRLAARLRMRAEPIYFMLFCGATPEMIRAMNEQILDVHPYTAVFEVH